MKKLVLVAFVLLASVMVLVGCKMEPEGPQGQKVYKFTSEPRILSDYKSPNNTDSEWTYVAFGDWPQTIKDKDVIVDETKGLQMGMFTYYLGSDGNHYVKVTANPYKEGYTYSDTSGVTVGSDVYFKVEPIVWRVLTDDYKVPGEDGELQRTGQALLLAENILTGGIPYYVDVNTRTITGAGTKDGEQDTVYPNNYKYSTIRAWLNGLVVVKSDNVNENDFTYDSKGFLQTAFTETAGNFIAPTIVDNSPRSSSDAEEEVEKATDYACENTIDKIFLLSTQEATKLDYGFAEWNQYGKDNTRVRFTTDYAKATGAGQDSPETESYGGWWWVRSPSYNNVSKARVFNYIGDLIPHVVNLTYEGVVPALCVSASDIK